MVAESSVLPGFNRVSKTPQYEVVLVTPELAGEWLATANSHNRNLRERKVVSYAEDMRNGDWSFTADPIRFSKKGNLHDGQHRLRAIVLAEIAVEMMVVTGLEEDAQEDIDTGIGRKFHDVLSLRGERDACSLAALIRLVYSWDYGTFRSGARDAVSTAQLSRILDKYPQLREVSLEAKRVSRYVSLPASMIGLAWWVFSGIDSEDASFFFERLADGQNLSKGHPIYELARTLETLRAGRQRAAGGNGNRVHQMALTIKAWNAYRSGREVGLLRWRAGGANPEVFPIPE